MFYFHQKTVFGIGYTELCVCCTRPPHPPACLVSGHVLSLQLWYSTVDCAAPFFICCLLGCTQHTRVCTSILCCTQHTGVCTSILWKSEKAWVNFWTECCFNRGSVPHIALFNYWQSVLYCTVHTDCTDVWFIAAWCVPRTLWSKKSITSILPSRTRNMKTNGVKILMRAVGLERRQHNSVGESATLSVRFWRAMFVDLQHRNCTDCQLLSPPVMLNNGICYSCLGLQNDSTRQIPAVAQNLLKLQGAWYLLFCRAIALPL